MARLVEWATIGNEVQVRVPTAASDWLHCSSSPRPSCCWQPVSAPCCPGWGRLCLRLCGGPAYMAL